MGPLDDKASLLQALFQGSGEPDPQSAREAMLRDLFQTPLKQGRMGIMRPKMPPLAAVVEEATTGKPVPTKPGMRSSMSLPATVAQKVEQAIAYLFPPDDQSSFLNPMASPLMAVAKPTWRALNATQQLKTLTKPVSAMNAPAKDASSAATELMRKILTRSAQATNPVAKAEAQAGLRSLNKASRHP